MVKSSSLLSSLQGSCRAITGASIELEFNSKISKLDTIKKIKEIMQSIISLENLECLLNEFYHSQTPNYRKKEIEAQLNEFRENENSPQISLQNLTSSFTLNNQFLFFFSVSTLEVRVYFLLLTTLMTHTFF